MKKSILLTVTILLSGLLFSQYSNLIIFSEGGEKFQVMLDGEIYNEQPEIRVEANEIFFDESCEITVMFEDKSINSVTRKLRILPAGNQFVMRLDRKKKGKYKLVKEDSYPIIDGIPSYLVKNIDHYAEPEPTNVIITETTTTTTTTNGSPEGVSLGVNVSDPNGNGNLNVNVGADPNSGTVDGEVSLGVNVDDPNVNGNLNVNLGTNGETTPNTETTTTTTTTITEIKPSVNDFVPGYTGRVTCMLPTTIEDFDKGYYAIKNEEHTDKMMKLAEMHFDNSCLTVDQILRIMSILKFDYTKMKFAKFAYLRVYDINNYDKIVNILENSNYRQELDNFILQNPR
jgi:hypothetical protein